MEEVQITAAIEPENADVLTVMYETTGGQVLDNGVFFAAEPGVYVITAHAMDESGASATITIIVEAAPVTDIAITGDKRVTVEKTLQLTAVVAPEYATDPTVTWSIVSGEEFASIDQNGVLTAIAAGKVNVPNICADQRVYCHGALIGLILDRNTVVSHNIKNASKKELTSWDDFNEYYIGHFGNNYNLEDLRTYYEPINDYEGSNLLGLQNPKYKVLPQHEYVEIITESQLLDQSTFEGWDFQNIWVMTENGPQLR